MAILSSELECISTVVIVKADHQDLLLFLFTSPLKLDERGVHAVPAVISALGYGNKTYYIHP